MTVAATAPAGAQQTQQRAWWVTLILGIAAILAGAALLFGPLATKLDTYLLLVKILGLWWVISGVLDLVHMFQDHSMWAWKLFMGVISILAGGWILVYPAAAALQLPSIFVFVIGIWALMYGIMMLVMAFRGAGWGAGILGAIELVLGIYLVANWSARGMGLAFLWGAAFLALIGGIFLVFAAFRQRSA
jgi:uncharacterized membrane protein HdeD (DUF308 family)